jgi:hypothetical protein
METKMTTTKITKIQRGVLAAAARRNDYAAWPIRDSKLNTGSATRVMKQLVRLGLVNEKPATAKAPTWREGEDGERLMAVITDAGLAAIGMLPAGKAGRRSSAIGKTAPVAAKRAAVATVSHDEPRRPRPGSKLAILVALLEREGGATVDEMVAATGWQPHSVRGVMSGTLAKKFAMQVVSEKIEGRDRTYRASGHSRA